MSAVPALKAVPGVGSVTDQDEKTAKDRIKGTHTVVVKFFQTFR